MNDVGGSSQRGLRITRKNHFAEFMLRIFVPDYTEIENPMVRRKYGYLGSIYGLLTNIILFAAKVFCAVVFSLGTLLADSVNNASDIGMCAIALVSVFIASRPASAKHPYGSARFEYVASLVIALLVIFFSAQQVIDTAQEMIDNSAWQTTFYSYAEPAFYISFAVMCVSALVKFSQYKLMVGLGRKTSSMTMVSTGKDARNDSLVSALIALSLLISYPLNFNVDPIAAIVVSAFVMLSGVSILNEASSAIMGKTPPLTTVKLFSDIIKSYPAILSIHDLEMHSYGHNEVHAYVHAEVDSATPIMVLRDEMDFIEKDVENRTGIRTFIHIDPIKIGDPETSRYRSYVLEAANEVDPDIAVNDFRIMDNLENAHEKMLVFDLVLPYDLLPKDRQVIEKVEDLVKSFTNDTLTFDIDIDDRTADLLLMLNDRDKV